jgi:3-hydroxyacyl-CoA dehydrogenase
MMNGQPKATPRAPERAAKLFSMSMLAVAAAVILFAAVVTWTVIRVSNASEDNCARIHTLTETLDRMIADSRKSLDAYVKDGTITPAQRDRELARIRQQRIELGGADCPVRTGLPIG